MSDIYEELKKLYEEESLYEMARISKTDTELNYDIWMDSAGKDRKNTHNTPRLKVDTGENQIPISIDKDSPELILTHSLTDKEIIKNLNTIKQYIKDNYDILIKHWNRELSDKEALNRLHSYKINTYKSLSIEYLKKLTYDDLKKKAKNFSKKFGKFKLCVEQKPDYIILNLWYDNTLLGSFTIVNEESFNNAIKGLITFVEGF